MPLRIPAVGRRLARLPPVAVSDALTELDATAGLVATLDARARLGVVFDAWLEEERERALAWAEAKLPPKRVLRARAESAGMPSDHPIGEILLVGITGVGKSTLANAVLGGPVADVGAGARVTKGVQRHRSPDGHTTVVDTEGLELGGEAGERRREHLVALARLADVVWYCVQADSERFQAAEANLVAELAEVSRVVVVLTQLLEPPVELERAIRAAHADVPIIAILAQPRALGPRAFAPSGLAELFAATRRRYAE